MTTATRGITSGMGENRAVRQRPEEGFRRWFLNGFFDLILWYDYRGGSLTGLQLCYGKPRSERAYTWTAGRQGHHRISDSRSGNHLGPATAVLEGDGGSVPEAVVARFGRESGEVPPDVVDLVAARLRAYNRGRT